MPRVNIFVKAQALHQIDEFCKGKGYSRSRFLIQSALREIKRAGVQPEVFRCEACHKYPAVGKYKVVAYDWETGESEKTLSLCQVCVDNAEKEGSTTKA